jgi:hypothetical protein
LRARKRRSGAERIGGFDGPLRSAGTLHLGDGTARLSIATGDESIVG